MIIRLLKKIFHLVFATADSRVAYYITLISALKRYKFRMLGLILSRRLQRKYGVFLSYNTVFDSSLMLKHPVGIIIGEGVRIGKNVVIFQNVTIGRSDTFVKAYPDIGDNVIIYSGAVIVGSVKIGKNCIVGANTVVTKDIPDNSIAVGVPARILKR